MAGRRMVVCIRCRKPADSLGVTCSSRSCGRSLVAGCPVGGPDLSELVVVLLVVGVGGEAALVVTGERVVVGAAGDGAVLGPQAEEGVFEPTVAGGQEVERLREDLTRTLIQRR